MKMANKFEGHTPCFSVILGMGLIAITGTGVPAAILKKLKGGIMRDALVFNGVSNLDFQDIRTNVIRIPEVIVRIREAQKIWDTVSSTPLDLANFIGSEDSIFLSNIKLKTFATAVVQVGLLDRYLKSHQLPEFVVGIVNGDSPLKFAIGQCGFFELIGESAALGGATPIRPVHVLPSAGEVPMLSGVHLAEYAVFQRRASDGGFDRISVEARDLERMLTELVEQHEIQRLIAVGPGSLSFGKQSAEVAARDIQLLESIDLDPMLSWFWQHLKENRLAIAN
jgi:hypothetical protein